MIEWDKEVPQKVLRSGSSWNDIQGFITDETKSGKVKRRYAHFMGKRQFTVTMHFDLEEYQKFKKWYKTKCLYGAESFRFPTIDAQDGMFSEYRFADGGAPSYSNIGGNIIEVTMTWEEL